MKLKFLYLNNIKDVYIYKDNNIHDILKKYSIDIDRNQKELKYIFNGKLFSFENLNEKMLKKLHKSKKSIMTFNSKKTKNNIEHYLNNIICPDCKTLSTMIYNDEFISLEECVNNHIFKYNNINEFMEEQNDDFVKCDICKKNIKKNNNKFYYCSCKKNICYTCSIIHNKLHNLINYENKYDFCCKHNNLEFVSYCNTCKINLCQMCESIHATHKITYLKKIKSNYTRFKDILDNVLELNRKIFNYKNEIKILNIMFNKMIVNLLKNLDNHIKLNIYIYKCVNNIINDDLTNYESIKNILNFNCKKMMRDINLFLNNDIKNKFLLLIEKLFKENISFNQIELSYCPKPDKEIRIFSEEFVSNNKTNCYLIKDDKIEELNQYHKCKKKSISEPIKISLISQTPLKDMKNMFRDCDSLRSFQSHNFDTSQVVNMSNMFSGCLSLSSIKGLKNVENVTKMNNMFKNCSSLINLSDISNWNISNVTNISGIFHGCTKLKNLEDISYWETGNIKNMSYMFCDCSSLINLPNLFWNTNNVVEMNSLFRNCKALKSLPDISSWNTYNIKNISYMFGECVSLISLPDISKWDITNVNNMSSLFYMCESLQSIPDISKWNTINTKNMKAMFYYCKSLLKLPDISLWNLENVVDISQMFYKCQSLKEMPDISKWTLKKRTKKEEIAYGCNFELNFNHSKSISFRNCKLFSNVNKISSEINKDELISSEN